MSGGLGHKRPLQRDPSRAAVRPTVEPPPPAATPEQRIDVGALREDLRGVISITGSSSNAGKTWLMERVIGLARARGFSTTALKITRTHINTCPRENDGCGVCDRLGVPFEIVHDRPRLDVPKKDTGRYLAAGASEVLWLLVKPSAVAEGLRAAIAAVPAGHLLIAEGNSFLDYTTGGVALMAVSDDFELKPSAATIRERIDAFVLHPTPGPRGTSAALRAALGDRPWLEPAAAAAFALDRLGRA